MSQSLLVLIVEDSESDAALVVRTLRQAGYKVNNQRVEDAAEMQAALQQQPWDVIISDYSLPQFDAPAALALLQESGLDLPFIVVSGTIGEETAVAMMKAGAHDYLMKDKLSRLAPAVEREIREAQSRRERRQAEEGVAQLSRRMELILNSAGEGIYGSDTAGKITFINPALAGMLGWEASELLGQPAHELFHHTRPDGRPYPGEECPIYLAFQDGHSHHLDDELFWRKDGTGFPVEYTSTPIREGDQITGTVVVVKDITERKRAEDKIRQQLDELQHWYNLTLDRETRTVELKREVNELLRRLNEPSRYPSAEA
jgi:PAS domain S-box-containing protein